MLGQFANSCAYQKEAREIVRDIIRERNAVEKDGNHKECKAFYDHYFD